MTKLSLSMAQIIGPIIFYVLNLSLCLIGFSRRRLPLQRIGAVPAKRVIYTNTNLPIIGCIGGIIATVCLIAFIAAIAASP